MIRYLVPVFVSLIFGLPFVIAAYPVLLAPTPTTKLIFLMLAPFTFTLSYLLIAGVLSKPFQKAIIPGKFPRKLDHPVYGPRRLYGLCWTAVYYFTPLYYVFLTIPFLKKVMFRAFGYKGNLDFTIYPDTWLRDLPVVSFGEGAYISNKSTVGTNICLSDGTILVDKVTVKKQGMVGHLAMLAPGAWIGESAEIGVGVAFGIRARMKANSKVGPGCVINHGADIGINAEVGTMSYLGIRAVIGDGLKLPGGSNIPAGVVLKTQRDVENHLSSETSGLNELRERVANLYAARTSPGLTLINPSHEDVKTGA